MPVESLSVEERDVVEARLMNAYTLSGSHTTMLVRVLNDALENLSLGSNPRIQLPGDEMRAARDKLLEQRRRLLDVIDVVSHRHNLEKYQSTEVTKAAKLADHLERDVQWLSKYA